MYYYLFSEKLSQGQVAHVAIAFEVPGGWKQEKEAVLLTVLQVLVFV